MLEVIADVIISDLMDSQFNTRDEIVQNVNSV